MVVNDFEESVFPGHPELGELKDAIYASGAVYASMSGSGSSIYGIFTDGDAARARTRQAFVNLWGRLVVCFIMESGFQRSFKPPYVAEEAYRKYVVVRPE